MLNPAQREVVFEILDVPSFDRVGIMVDVEHLSTFAIDYGESAKRTSAFIDARLNDIALPDHAATEARLIKLIEKWEELDTDPSNQENGNIAALSGINDDPNQEREIVRGRVERIIGLRLWNEKRTIMREPSVKFMGAVAG